MGLKNAMALLLGATTMAGGGPSDGASKPTLASGKPAGPARAIPLKGSARARAPLHEELFRGDMIPDLGLGCSNPSGSTGGPNDWATKVTAATTPPFEITTTTYNVYSFNSGPTWDIVAWQNGASPGAEIGRTSLGAASGTQGDHTAAVLPSITVPAGQQTFYFGLSQGVDTSGVRIGMDDSGSTPSTVFIRAPGCGLGSFGAVESIGYPGYWVQRISIDVLVPVELMNFSVR